MRLIIISDTHGRHNEIVFPEHEDGDVLIHAGDFCNWGVKDEVKAFDKWLGTLPYKEKIVIAGNHDLCLDRGLRDIKTYDGHDLIKNAHYLENESLTLKDGDPVKFWGSPITPPFFNWAFMCPRDSIHAYWDSIPTDTDVVITHGPMYGIHDYVDNDLNDERNVGCKELYKRLQSFYPAIHICGHIHEQHGIKTISNHKNKKTECINASLLDDRYKMVYKPMYIRI